MHPRASSFQERSLHFNLALTAGNLLRHRQRQRRILRMLPVERQAAAVRKARRTKTRQRRPVGAACATSRLVRPRSKIVATEEELSARVTGPLWAAQAFRACAVLVRCSKLFSLSAISMAGLVRPRIAANGWFAFQHGSLAKGALVRRQARRRPPPAAGMAAKKLAEKVLFPTKLKTMSRNAAASSGPANRKSQDLGDLSRHGLGRHRARTGTSGRRIWHVGKTPAVVRRKSRGGARGQPPDLRV